MQRKLETLTLVHPMPGILWVGTLSGLTHLDPANPGAFGLSPRLLGVGQLA